MFEKVDCKMIWDFSALINWSLGHAAVILDERDFQMHIKFRYFELFLWNCPQATKPHWWLVDISSGNSLVPLGTMPLPDPLLTQFYVYIWRHNKLWKGSYTRGSRSAWQIVLWSANYRNRCPHISSQTSHRPKVIMQIRYGNFHQMKLN